MFYFFIKLMSNVSYLIDENSDTAIHSFVCMCVWSKRTSRRLRRIKLYNGVFLKCLHWIQRQKKIVITLKGLEPATSCVRDQGATTVPARHMWKTASLNWAQFIFQWFIRFTEFNESSTPFRKKLQYYTLGAKKCITVSNYLFLSVYLAKL